jgi:hypothetical protein
MLAKKFLMQEIKLLPAATIKKIRNLGERSGIQYKLYGKHSEVNKYTDQELTEMYHGIYKDKKVILVDGDYFIDLKDVVEIICSLDSVSYLKGPSADDYKTNGHNHLENIRTFYVKDYFLVTSTETQGRTKHSITSLLCAIGAINKGRNHFVGLYSIKNSYKSLQPFKQGKFPKDLYHPVKNYINGLFFSNDYHISNFKVETQIELEPNL